ncbi:hypothetical protein C6502_13595 [Candidatus Poribacteria bacterium]|nr:MAG: hypothetical protein C6502_13595 [Candidatus Poribacteria bacterium]
MNEVIVEKIENLIDFNKELGEKVTKEIDSLREELITIRHLLEQSYSPDPSLPQSDQLSRVFQEYRKFPLDTEDPIRWGFMGAWGQGGAHLATSVLFTSVDNFLSKNSNEAVAAFAQVFSDPRVIGICKCLFRSEDPVPREQVKQVCNLNDEELDTALEPMLEWYFVRWQDDKLQKIAHGINWAMTLIGMSDEARNERRKQEESTSTNP